MKINIPNVLTIFRILLTPLFIICLFYPNKYANLWALFIFIIASVTDAFDGHYARKYDQVTRHGKFLDPLADKILVSSAFISFAIMDLIPFWMVIMIIFRDLFVTGLRMVMESQGLTMITSKIAKTKTAIQLSVIIFILAFLGFKIINANWLSNLYALIVDYRIIYYFAMIATIFTVLTGIMYIYNNKQIIRKFLLG